MNNINILWWKNREGQTKYEYYKRLRLDMGKKSVCQR